MSLPLASSRLTGVRRTAFGGIVVGTVGIAVAYGSAFLSSQLAAVGPYVMAIASPLCLVSTMTLGAVRSGAGLGRLAIPFGLVLVLVAGGFVLALVLPPDTATSAYVLGLPRRAAVIVYGVGMLPLFVLPLAYAITFDASTLSDDDIQRVRDARLITTRDGSPSAGPAAEGIVTVPTPGAQ